MLVQQIEAIYNTEIETADQAYAMLETLNDLSEQYGEALLPYAEVAENMIDICNRVIEEENEGDSLEALFARADEIMASPLYA